MVIIEAPDEWRAIVQQPAARHVAVTYTCPECQGGHTINVQAPPWPDGECETQLWCHRDQIGADATLRDTATPD